MIGSSQETTAKQPLILVVDDDVTCRLLASAALENAGFRVIEAADGADGLESFSHDRPDLVLLDIDMPKFNGLEVCEWIRKIDADIPILMLTGSDDHECIRDAFAAGATDFTVKPVNWMILTQRCHFTLKAARNVAQLRRSEEQSKAAHRMARLGTWQIDLETNLLKGSDEFMHTLGFPIGSKEVRLDDLLSRIPEKDRERVGVDAAENISRGKSYSSYVEVKLPNGQHRVTRLFADPILDDEGELILLSGICQDVTEQAEAEEKIRFLSHYDPITGLAGRALLDEMLETAIQRGMEAGKSGAVLRIAFGGVRRVSESIGQQAGDAALQQMSARVIGWVRENGPALFSPESQLSMTVGRIGSAELALTVPEIDDPQRAAVLAERLITEVSGTLRVADTEVAPALAVGIAVWPFDGKEPDTLLRNSRMAMEHAANQVDQQYHYFTSDMNDAALERIELEKDLRHAIEQGQLCLYYQPKIDTMTGRITGAEALIRWQHPEAGLRYPIEFIPLAEETGLILPMGEWVVREACRQQRLWREKGLPPLAIAANLSPAQLASDSIVAVVAESLREAGGNPADFELEITETALFQDSGVCLRRLEELKELGVRISLDDFGTGYSSLSYLKSFPVDTVKIDQSFIEGLGTDANDTAVIEAIVSLAKALGLHVVAEGTETENQWRHLRELRCDEVQGFLFSRAVEADAFEALVRETPWLASAPAGRIP